MLSVICINGMSILELECLSLCLYSRVCFVCLKYSTGFYRSAFGLGAELSVSCLLCQYRADIRLFMGPRA